MTKKLLTITLIFLSLNVFAQERIALVIGNGDPSGEFNVTLANGDKIIENY